MLKIKDEVDLKELEKAAGEIQEILKPVFKLYTKNVQTYLKYKNKEE